MHSLNEEKMDIEKEFTSAMISNPIVHHWMMKNYNDEVSIMDAFRLAIIDLVKQNKELTDIIVEMKKSYYYASVAQWIEQ